jgi:hypothetical protein
MSSGTPPHLGTAQVDVLLGEWRAAVTRHTSLTNTTTSLRTRSGRPRLSLHTAATSTTTCKMNGRYPQHLSHQRNHFTSAAIYTAHGRYQPPQLAG